MASGGRKLRVRRLGGSRAGEMRLTRFLRNDAVTCEEMLSEAAARTAERCAGRHVVAIQDTTVLDSSGGGGAYLHAVIALDGEDDAILGLVDGQFLERSGGRRAGRRQARIEEKESFRWLMGADQAASVCAGAASVTVVADRESDIFEMFALRPEGAELVVRAAHDRALADGGALFAAVDAAPVAGRAGLVLAAKPGRKRRTAQMAVRFLPVALACPANGQRRDLPRSVAVWLVDVRESDPPPGEAAVHWRLLTTHAVSEPAAAFLVVDLYRRRWAIEQLFRTLKSQGFDIEDLGIEAAAPRNRLVTAALIAAVCIQQLVHARDGGPGPLRPVRDAFAPEDQALLEACCASLEGKTERQKNPHPKGSLAYAAWVCARLGGWTGYYGKPGPIVMLEGWLEFQAMKRGVNLLRPHSLGVGDVV
ncbi:IS4 family transposase [Sinorhizobium fredii]|uniref:IS4 family transposase n=1 Tax=Rhizobium fredii TaxID=380 RepID=UPI001FCB426F|nr:IS4 family transposase [Sinorhizobium fredii]